MLMGLTMQLAGCRGKPLTEPAQKSYHLRGKIVAVGTGEVTVNGKAGERAADDAGDRVASHEQGNHGGSAMGWKPVR